MIKLKEQDRMTTGKLVAGLVIAILVSWAVLSVVCPYAQAAVGWSNTYGGANAENGYTNVLQTSDGGYVMVCDTSSYGAGVTDFYLVKTSADGDMQWQRTFGGPLSENAARFCKTSDGGYALTGCTASYGAGSNDVWLVKTDADGYLQWSKTYGGTGDDMGHDVSQTPDGGYALLGYTASFGAGSQDVWLIVTDEAGNMKWNKTFGTAALEEGVDLILTSDGGYALVSIAVVGGFRTWLIKLNDFGNMVWNKTYSIGSFSWTNTGIQTADGGFALVGAGAVGDDVALIRTDSFGNMLWNKTYGGTGKDRGWTPVQMTDEGYIIIGETDSFGAGGTDGWLFRTDASGNMLWNRTYGGTGTDLTDNIIPTADGGYAIVGYTNSSGAGNSDLWLIKTDEFGVVPEGLTIGVMLLLSTAAVIVGTRCFRKRPKLENW